ncbi:interleukin-8-like [Amblyraja radiata]|uniref:interleukin-8-like n=1 Tax=Amblyraja radiata TaxID=386614 RepID=UPI001403CA8E|nr:interleukin-8-like [Amblyraja radiata]
MSCRYTFTIVAVLVLSGLLTDARAIGNLKIDLRCRCINTSSVFIHPKYMKKFEIFPSGPHCENTEIIATLILGRKICLNPESKWVKKMLKKIAQ